MDGRIADSGGPEAMPGSPRADPAAGELVTETLDYDGGRPVTVYVPPGPPEAVVFAGDGQGVSRWGVSLEAAGVRPTMIVGVHGLADETLRLQEYSPVFDAERFAAHERFFVEDVGRWAVALRDAGADVVMSERVASANLRYNTACHEDCSVPGGNRASPSAAGALAARIALARMSSDSVIPRDRAVSARTSRSCGRRRTATRAVR